MIRNTALGLLVALVGSYFATESTGQVARPISERRYTAEDWGLTGRLPAGDQVIPQLQPLELVPKPIDRLRILVIADREANGIQQAIRRDAEIFTELMTHIFYNPRFPGLRGKAEIYDWNAKKNEFGRMHPVERVREFLDNHPLAVNEGLIVYYSGHGKSMRDGGFIKQCLATSVGQYDRERLKWDLLREEAPVIFLFTDMCAGLPLSIMELSQRQRQLSTDSEPRGMSDDKSLERFYTNLFLQQRGILDVSSSQIGQMSWTNPDGGSLFTEELVSVLRNPGNLAGNPNEFSTWDKVFPTIAKRTTLAFASLSERVQAVESQGTEQFPVVYNLPFAKQNGVYISHFGFAVKRPIYDKSKLSIEMPIYGGVLGNKGRRLSFAVYFSRANGEIIKSVNEHYTDVRGNVAVNRMIKIDRDEQLIRHFVLEIPVKYLNLSREKGKTHYLAQLKVYDGEKLVAGPVSHFFWVEF